MSVIKVYIAGKIAKESSFKSHHWRDDFCKAIEELSCRNLINLDPLANEEASQDVTEIFKKDCKLINDCDLMIVNLTDDISVGGSQEILIAKYLKKPVIGLAPLGGKFNMSTREMFGKVINDYKDPFVFSTCDVVCATIVEVAEAVASFETIVPKTFSIIDKAISTSFEK